MRVITRNKWNNFPPDKKKSFIGFIRDEEGNAHAYEEGEEEEYARVVGGLVKEEEDLLGEDETEDKRTLVEKDLEEGGLFLLGDFSAPDTIESPYEKLKNPLSVLTNAEIKEILRDLCNI